MANRSKDGRSSKSLGYRGGLVDAGQIARIRQLIRRHPELGRHALAERVCKLLGWRSPNGTLRLWSCQVLLRRLDARGVIELPPSRRSRSKSGPRRGVHPEEVWLGPTPGWEASVRPEGSVVVQPIRAEERAGWEAFMRRFHYLGEGAVVGESIRYAAWMEGELVALLGWGAAAFHNGPRDRHVGWDEWTKVRRLSYVVNNVRFLILPWIRLPNLASRILGANLRRLSRDWEGAYGHPVWLAETFVDLSRFHGGCYRASNWIYLGQTRGWSRHGDRYSFHGRTKAVFVYWLSRRGRSELCAVPRETQPNKEVRMHLDVERLALDGPDGLFEALKTVTDVRKRRGIRHPLDRVLALCVCATLCGAKSYVAIAEWVADQDKEMLKRLGSRDGTPPSERTIRRVLRQVNVQEIDDKTGCWVARRQAVVEGQGVALDGKTLRGSADGDRPAVHLLSAVVHGAATVVAQTPVPGKTNEITCVEPLLRNLDLTGAVVTADALLTQKEIARHVVEGNYFYCDTFGSRVFVREEVTWQ